MNEMDYLNMLNKGFFNPFSELIESKSHPHARSLRVPLKTKFKDMYSVIFGTLKFQELLRVAHAYKIAKGAGDDNGVHAAKQNLFIIAQQTHLGIIDLFVLIPFIVVFFGYIALLGLANLLIQATEKLYAKNKALGVLIGLLTYPLIVVVALGWIVSGATLAVVYMMLKGTLALITTAVFAVIPLIVHGITELVGKKDRAAFKTLPIESFSDARNLTLSDSDRIDHQKDNVRKIVNEPDLYDHCELKEPDVNGATQLEQDGYLAIYAQRTPYEKDPDLIIRFSELLRNKAGSVAMFKFNFFKIADEDENPIAHRMKLYAEQTVRNEHKDLYDPDVRAQYGLDRPVHRPHYLSIIFNKHGIDHLPRSAKSSHPKALTNG